jgi:competence protein ComEC
LAFKVALAAAISVVTTLIAGGLSSIPAAYHFGRISPYSVIANGLALPIIGLIVMPFALISALMMPLGLEALPLAVMGEGLKLVLWISDWVAGFPGANMVAAQPALASVILLAVGAVLLCLLLGPIRWSGLALAGIAMGLMLTPRMGADIYIERSGQNAAIRDANGNLVPAHSRRGRFAVEKWLVANGDEARLAEAAKRPGWSCTGNRCESGIKGKRVAYVSRAEGQTLECVGLDILITDFPLRGLCKTVQVRIDRFDLWRRGSHTLTIDGQNVGIETVAGFQGNRPWSLRPERRATPYRPTVQMK